MIRNNCPFLTSLPSAVYLCKQGSDFWCKEFYSVCSFSIETRSDRDINNSNKFRRTKAMFLINELKTSGSEKALQSSTKVFAQFHTFAVSVRELIYQFVSFPQFNQCCLSCWSCYCSFTTLLGGRGLPILVMSLDTVPKIPCQRICIWSKCAKDFCRGL